MDHSRDKKNFDDIFSRQLHEYEESQRAEWKRSICALESRVRNGSADAATYSDLADCYSKISDLFTATDILRQGVKKFPKANKLHYRLVQCLHESGLDHEALAAAGVGSAELPNDFALTLAHYLYLPKLYDSRDDIRFWHSRFGNGLERCVSVFESRRSDNALTSAQGLSSFTPFLLPYQGFNDMQLVRRYGAFVHGVMSAAYPKWSSLSYENSVDRLPLVGYVSAYFRSHTAGKLFLGWLKQRNRSAYRAHCYYVGERADSITEQYRHGSDAFFQSPHLKTICGAIRRDRPDVLVFTDIGMEPVTSQVAALRLAPVQCTAWGHPVTTGLPTIDYFLSGELMEPPDAQENYTERLIELPNLGIYYEKPIIPRGFLMRRRRDFGLPDDCVLYLSCQSSFKHLPQYDRLYAEIAFSVRNARFVFLEPNESLRGRLLNRLERAFSSVGLRAHEYCFILPHQNPFDYWNLNMLSDIFLDTPEWSGGRTSLEAVACGLPIVTRPGQLMRSRHTAGILKLLGVPELVAESDEEYVRIASRLGMNQSLRCTLASEIAEKSDRLFADQSVMAGLESFFQECFVNARPGNR